jgi:hypothetical protein
MYLIGDIHGRFHDYFALLAGLNGTSTQLGDHGWGFPDRPPYDDVDLAQRGHTFFEGNHDNQSVCSEKANYLGRVGYRAPVFFIGGGYSIDRFQRTPGVDWWPDEQIDEATLARALDLYKEIKPRIVISHDAPTCAAETFLKYMISKEREDKGYESGYYRSKLNGVTLSHMSKWMERMLLAHQPETWVFAHFHSSLDFKIEHCDTQFSVLNELEVREFPFDYEPGVATITP